ncbi:MAG TPA: PDZ domain-containing protein, partial [Ferruginibacter sp.]|nr:PDZ domain-containing protein [Ferruginibacter sp.]
FYTHGNLEGFIPSWSPDSRWLAYDRDLPNAHNAIFIYDFQNKKTTQATSGFYNSFYPTFDPDGKYLYLLTSQAFQPTYSDLDNTFIYANSTKIAAISLKKETSSILAPKNDSVGMKEEPKPTPSKDSTKDSAKKDIKDKEKAAEPKSDVKPVVIHFEGLENRMVLLPPAPGNIGPLGAAKGKIIYMRYPNTGSSETLGQLKFYDIDKREEKTIIDAVNNYRLSFNRQKILVNKSGVYAVLSPDENQKFDKTLRLNEMMVSVNPAQEWKQIFNDAWRLERDYFYEANMHGVNWDKVRQHYGAKADNAMSREELDFILGEMIGELNASHTYHGGGDLEREKTQSTGYLGINWESDGKYYKVKKILRAAPWDAEVRSSLDEPGVMIKEGDYILAVNGLALNVAEEPYAAFQGLANKTVELTYNTTPSFTGAKTAIVQTMAGEYRLRNLSWIEEMRKRVDQATNGEVGYIFVPSTGLDGQTELMRQYNAQTEKKALIIDERFNDGGQIPDRFVELLNRTPVAYWATRDGQAWPWPPNAQFGPKVMLMNGWSGSGGDAFPDYFRKKGLGPLIGTRTWGGLIGISGVPGLIDGGSITVPTFRMYNVDGTWFKEGHGVDPDIDVQEDLGAMAKGVDVQLERAITEIKALMKSKGYMIPKLPAYEKR